MRSVQSVNSRRPLSSMSKVQSQIIQIGLSHQIRTQMPNLFEILNKKKQEVLKNPLIIKIQSFFQIDLDQPYINFSEALKKDKILAILNNAYTIQQNQMVLFQKIEILYTQMFLIMNLRIYQFYPHYQKDWKHKIIYLDYNHRVSAVVQICEQLKQGSDQIHVRELIKKNKLPIHQLFIILALIETKCSFIQINIRQKYIYI